MSGKRILLFLCVTGWVLAGSARAQSGVPDLIVPDTVVVQKQYEESTRFYDRLKERSENSKFARRLYRALVSSDDRANDTPEAEKTGLEKEITYFRRFAGQRINSIEVVRNNIFRNDYHRSDFRTLANSIHTITRESRIRKNLLFKVGDELSPSMMALNEQLLRSLDYLSDASILVLEGENSEGVDIHVVTRDSWSLSLTVRSVPHDRRYLDIYDDNIFGQGNRLDLRTYFGLKGEIYGGQMLEYTATNLFGSFYELNALAGWGFDERRFAVSLDKDFLLPSDYMAGAAAEDNKYYDPQMTQDTVLLVRRQKLDLWAGKSWDFPAVKSSFYLSGRYNLQEYKGRPEVRPDSNTYYHSTRQLLFNTGVYRETYYRGNMIYGFGRTESIPYGHRFELTAGRQWGEFDDRWYTAFTSAIGLQDRLGYMRGEASIGSFWDANGKASQSLLSLELDGFTNLWRLRRNYIRHFFRVRYMKGWNRLQGEGEVLTLWDDSSLQGVRRNGITGTHRLICNTETVFFSPIYFYGFRFVFFGFADVGWIGNSDRMSHNEFYSAVGLGLRLKNERLNFTTIQLRLGFGFNKYGALDDYRYLRYSGQSKFRVPPFKADKPQVYEFR